jgi:hypothetical protein
MISFIVQKAAEPIFPHIIKTPPFLTGQETVSHFFATDFTDFFQSAREASVKSVAEVLVFP